MLPKAIFRLLILRRISEQRNRSLLFSGKGIHVYTEDDLAKLGTVRKMGNRPNGQSLGLRFYREHALGEDDALGM